MYFNSNVYRSNLDFIEGKNDLCTCEEDLKVLKNMQTEITIKMSDIEAKFEPNYFANEKIGCYCPNCKKSYLISRKYEASSKVDYETIESVIEKDFDDLYKYFRLREEEYNNCASERIGIDYKSIKVLKEDKTEARNTRKILFTDMETISEFDNWKNK